MGGTILIAFLLISRITIDLQPDKLKKRDFGGRSWNPALA